MIQYWRVPTHFVDHITYGCNEMRAGTEARRQPMFMMYLLLQIEFTYYKYIARDHGKWYKLTELTPADYDPGGASQV